jgi:K+-sensing histidine kinase KdpD
MAKNLQIPEEVDLTAFISKEAHDLKSPFNRALGFLKLVLKGMDGPISNQVREDLTVVYLNAQYTLTMIGALVDMSRLMRSEREPTFAPLPVDYLIQQAITEWKRKYHKENSVEITFTAPEIQIDADEILFRQGLLYWMLYINEFSQGEANLEITVEDRSPGVVFTLKSHGEKQTPPPECDLTLYGFTARKILDLHHGTLLRLEETDEGVLAQFSIPVHRDLPLT